MLRALCRRRLPYLAARSRPKATAAKDEIEVDDLCIPIEPTWSVQEQIAASPRTRITPSQLGHLHKLSGLVPPEPNTPEHHKLTRELEDLIRLVEAVKGVDVSAVKVEGEVPDGRIWQTGRGMELRDYNMEKVEDNSEEKVESLEEGKQAEGTELVKHAQRTVGGFYVVEHDRKR